MIINPPAPAASSVHRLKRGTKASDAIPTNGSGSSKDDLLNSIDGPFQLAEYLACKVRADPHDVKGLVEVPKDGQDADRDVWIYEHLRRLPVDLAPLVSQLLTSCSRDTCPSMKADEWLYLCVAHGSGGTEDCCAIDYILHTLDCTTTLLNSTKKFPSRMSIPASSLNNFPSLSRRLSRIFSHAYFHHREAFLTFEAETSLYERFMTLCETYGLVGSSLFVIPKGELGIGGAQEEEDDEEAWSSGDEDEDADQEGEDEKEEEGEGKHEEGHGKGTADKNAGKAQLSSRDSLFARGGKANGAMRAKSLDRRTSADGGVKHDKGNGNGKQEQDDNGKLGNKARKSVVPRGSAVAAVQAQAHAQANAQSQSESSVEAPKSAAEQLEEGSVIERTESQAKDEQEEETPVHVPESAIKATTRGRGRGTLGRGKQSRGTVLWSSDSAPPVPLAESAVGDSANESAESKKDAGEDGSQASDKTDGGGQEQEGKEEQLVEMMEGAEL